MHYYTDVLKKYAVFDGRATRKEYWMFQLWNVIIVFIIASAMVTLAINEHSILPMIVYWAYLVAIILPAVGVSIRRLHDTNHTGWWLFISLIPVIGAIVLLIFYVEDSTPDNQYGPSPKGMHN